MKRWMIMGWVWLAMGQAMAFQAAPSSAPPHQAASQVHSSEDARLQAAVRQAIANDASLSDAAHHVVVIVAEGAVVLRGPVKSDAEKSKIDALVRKMAGVKEVTNEIDVKQ
ncbi:BON domain-containing protein [Dyella telluris]|uniref:BON domain-containing protein n=1 Tax=Dyella telluris TaxID=2763498 RepID=A0A7G8Q3W1_9GAMM|nr:BON domain-containing protein [Dyella telluris]QNK01469.1 BON domain-containing protein [Dyella telluris]